MLQNKVDDLIVLCAVPSDFDIDETDFYLLLIADRFPNLGRKVSWDDNFLFCPLLC